VSETVVVIAAHAFEARSAAGVGRAVTKEPWGQWMLYRGEMWDMPLTVIRSGPGKVAAAAATQAAIQYLDPDLLISFGTASAPDVETKIGSLAVAHTVIDVALTELGTLPVHIPDRFAVDAAVLDSFLGVPGAAAASLMCWEGHIASPVHRPAASAGIEDFLVVDWESAAVAQVAQMWDVPWAAVKVVSDHGEAERLRLLALAAKRPLQWAAEVCRRACFSYFERRKADKTDLGEVDESTEDLQEHEEPGSVEEKEI
jgi:adenosylhomocysteine nucleosidase